MTTPASTAPSAAPSAALPTPLATELLELALATAADAAALVSAGRASAGDDVDTKTSVVDVVTAVDKASEALVVDRLLGARPDDGVLGEEGASREGSSGVRWVVDPIDGTVNFLYGLGSFAVCIAAEVDGVTEVGVVVDVPTGETYAAVRGGGAWVTRDGVRTALRSSSPASLELTLVATGFAYDRGIRTRQGHVLAAVLPEVRDVRRWGSAAVEICLAAAGRVDAFYQLDLKPWDHVAADLVAAEAGLRVSVTTGHGSGDPLVTAVPASIETDFLALVARAHEAHR
ncbi:inositol monophosphatase family protein [Modestobacter sp. Leaf380]|uniref:inositol monophosphatase family protein n=1 Tax=Modestobacter sp. Leaf380 TaxID=1736356 RepID=UPI0006FDB4C3|nr:inositol monophosphatase family protein [Modestobacter sp. Leaf380]KQS63641.1 inositol monophosphatase [Modestobacter sp. Leaf380]